MSQYDLSDKHILITGACLGIGRATAIMANRLGAHVSLIARNDSKLDQLMQLLRGDANQYYPFDLTSLNAIENLIKTIVAEQGAIDGLVHCAGIAPMRPLNLLKPETLQQVMCLNFYSYVELIRCICKKYNFRPGLSIVGISSVSSKIGDKSLTAYSASKAAMDAASRSLAKELADKSIRVNTVVAGFIKTELADSLLEMGALDAAANPVLNRQYLGLGEPEDAASAICFLLSDAAKFITGTGLVADGG